jgi:hypothetical protein
MKAVLLLMCMAIAGCATGTRVSSEQSATLTPGVSTESSTIAALGRPDVRKINADGTLHLMYMYSASGLNSQRIEFFMLDYGHDGKLLKFKRSNSNVTGTLLWNPTIETTDQAVNPTSAPPPTASPVVSPPGPAPLVAAEQLPEIRYCNPRSRALISKGSAYELYRFECADGHLREVRCEYGACRRVK